MIQSLGKYYCLIFEEMVILAYFDNDESTIV
jgi:hypothetical protein